MWTDQDRSERFHEATKTDQRNDFERDRDRILYSSAFHRLAGITQVVRAGEQEVFHNRQQHTLKVAQVGRRLAQRCLADHPSFAHSIDAEVVEAACLAHDLGHPPFGHVGEALLDELVQKTDPDGFEGNAQTFRILTKLALRFPEHGGLNPTRATLAATLKYPWLRDKSDPNKTLKWSAYKADKEAFDFARQFHPSDDKTIEATLMDWADDIAYSVHDLEDFHRCGAIPWIEVFASGDLIVEQAAKKWHNAPSNAPRLLEKALGRLYEFFDEFYDSLLFERYVGSKDQRLQLRNLTSTLIGRFIKAAKIVRPGKVRIGMDEQTTVLVLKQIFREFIIKSPSLIAQQHGQKNILRALYGVILTEGGAQSFPTFLPMKLRYLWEMADGSKARFAADCVASLTEKEVVGMYGRLFGTSDSSVLDPIVR
ncbi:deoxyguanosinetriphosphate triphosphohydrolase [Rhizobium sp. UPM1132]|uniref:deoxyguanosinetriphosphate triphosphohydrolase family protein n=1 Tax=Rhizobium ruizarguesonis TaxID=2081791 RepID=UPI0014475D2C|nr:dNTP triphosphohydrolase [Rhizobium ruizarguesonis]NKQ73833.1 deoxyguanosinetriphosphate triphosphohydrolase [Rhizobium ruizarguesonis]